MPDFQWSANVKTKLDEMSSVFQPIRSELQAEPGVTIGSLLSARCAKANFLVWDLPLT